MTGKFDSPDRMFHSISSCYDSAMTNHADVKELIPEFYNPNHDFDFLINAKSLQLGAMQTGDRVNDVALPPWAKSPRDFLKKNRKALESDICTVSFVFVCFCQTLLVTLEVQECMALHCANNKFSLITLVVVSSDCGYIYIFLFI